VPTKVSSTLLSNPWNRRLLNFSMESRSVGWSIFMPHLAMCFWRTATDKRTMLNVKRWNTIPSMYFNHVIHRGIRSLWVVQKRLSMSFSLQTCHKSRTLKLFRIFFVLSSILFVYFVIDINYLARISAKLGKLLLALVQFKLSRATDNIFEDPRPMWDHWSALVTRMKDHQYSDYMLIDGLSI